MDKPHDDTRPLLPLTSREVQCAIARSAMHVDPFDGAMASCSWIFRLRGEWARTPTSQEVAAMLEEMRRDPEKINDYITKAVLAKQERDRYRELLERIVAANDMPVHAGCRVDEDKVNDQGHARDAAIAEARKELGL